MNRDPYFSQAPVPPPSGQPPVPQMQPAGLAPDDLLFDEPRGSPFMKFALITLSTLAILAILSVVALRVFQARQHHLAEGYLFQNAAQLLYFHVQESFFGGAVAGTFYPNGAACALGGAETSQHVSGEVTNATLTLKDDDGAPPGGEVDVSFKRAGPEMILLSAKGAAFDSTRPPLGMAFEPSADAAYAQAQKTFCPGLPGF